MLRLLLLLLYLAASYSSGQAQIGGGLDPDGLRAQTPPTTDGGGGLDPNGLKTQPPPTPTVDIGGGWDPNG